ncbi:MULTISPECIES: hypothetical protein [Pseudomonas]|uniref:Uncharacterized protein n=1 Tax=Pseudomonas putida (strain DOT-T1E) TaxID=1196325 RepID=I7C6J8_PSEPT|nr:MULTISPECIES: hypothetical protein [Pseudomonas]AFO48751.1 hypothetical protein T1E_2912 [Pseudomonas putida DOT-T1E]UZM92184.1 hypothetical protein OPZ46_20260 [Pseudomonas putida DOT-T1E]
MKINADEKQTFDFLKQENKFWSVGKDEVFKSSVANYYSFDILPAAKVATRLIKNRAWETESLKMARDSLREAGRFNRRKIVAEIQDYEAHIAMIEKKLDVLRKTKPNQLLAFRDLYAGTDSHFNDLSYAMMNIQDLKSGLISRHGLKEIEEEDYEFLSSDVTDEENYLERLESKYNRKIGILHCCFIALWVGGVAFINNSEMSFLGCLTTVIMYFLAPHILRQYIKPTRPK